MAQRVTVQMVDDLDGTSSDTIDTVAFSLDGVDYEIDLHTDNAERLRAGLAEFVTVAHRVGGRAKTRAARRPAATAETRERNQAVRDWARTNGWPMSDRGRIPADVIAAYQEAQTAIAVDTTSRTTKPRARRKEPAFSS